MCHVRNSKRSTRHSRRRWPRPLRQRQRIFDRTPNRTFRWAPPRTFHTQRSIERSVPIPSNWPSGAPSIGAFHRSIPSQHSTAAFHRTPRRIFHRMFYRFMPSNTPVEYSTECSTDSCHRNFPSDPTADIPYRYAIERSIKACHRAFHRACHRAFCPGMPSSILSGHAVEHSTAHQNADAEGW